MSKARVQDVVADVLAQHWLRENPYCGLPSQQIRDRVAYAGIETSLTALRGVISRMKKRGEVSTRKAAGDVWVYPKRPLLEPRDPLPPEAMGIYTRRLRLGGAQYEQRFFDRQALDRYLRDPRYRVDDSGVSGHLAIRDNYYRDPNTLESDKVWIQGFGTAYREDGTPAIAVPLIYLGHLSKEHQQYWASFEIGEQLALDYDYYAQDFEGKFVDRVSPFDALLQEICEINILCDMIGYRHLFRQTFERRTVADFRWMTKPTAHALQDLIHALDKVTSENINRNFFGAVGIPLDEEIKIKGREGTVEVRPKGTIRLLEEFLRQRVRLQEPEVVDNLIGVLKEIRKRRMEPAHDVTDDAYDASLVNEQREIVNRAYGSIRLLRLILALHPKAASYAPPAWLQKSRIG